MSGRRARPEWPRWLDAQLHLLDRQVIDVHGVPITTVDDLELSDVPFGVEDTAGDSGTSGHRTAQRTGAGDQDLRWPTSQLAPASDTLGAPLRRRRGRSTSRSVAKPLDVTWTESWVRDQHHRPDSLEAP